MQQFIDNYQESTLIQLNKMVYFTTLTPLLQDWSQIPLVVRYNIIKNKLRSCKNMKLENLSNERICHEKGIIEPYVNHTTTTCTICKRDCTYILPNRRPHWLKYKTDENGNFKKDGKWDKSSYICNLCYNKENSKLPNSNINIIKSQRKFRNKQLSINCTSGRGFIGEQIWCKVRGVKNCNIETDNFSYVFDHSPDREYGIVNTKISSLHTKQNNWNFDLRGKCDNVVLICMNVNWIEIERIYIIPSKEIGNRTKTTISKNSTSESWYEKYRIDNAPYNEVYKSMNLSDCPVLKSDEKFDFNTIERPKVNITERFLSHVDKNTPNGCHIWTGALNINDYGNFYYNERYVSAHVASYEIFKEKIPEGKEIHHLCENRKCVNPDHLILETHQENMNRLKGRLKNHWKQSQLNTYSTTI